MQVDLRSLRDALEPVGLQAHVESLAVVQAAERDDVERLALHAIAEDQGGGLDCVEGHPPREGRLHRSSLSIAVRNLRGYERIAERAIELPADLEDPDPRPRLDADGMAEAEVRARAVRAHDLLVRDRKSTRLNSSHANISYAVFCLKKKKNTRTRAKYASRKPSNSWNR